MIGLQKNLRKKTEKLLNKPFIALFCVNNESSLIFWHLLDSFLLKVMFYSIILATEL